MASLIDIGNQSCEDMNMEKELLNKLERLKQEQPESYLLQNFAVVAVDDNKDGELKEVLAQLKNNQNSPSVILMPYKLKGSHWIGIWMLFKANGQLERVEFIDPVESSSFNLD